MEKYGHGFYLLVVEIIKQDYQSSFSDYDDDEEDDDYD